MSCLRHRYFHRSVQGVSRGVQGGEDLFEGTLIVWVAVLFVSLCLVTLLRLLTYYQEDKERRARRAYVLNHLVTKKVLIGGSKKTAEVQKFHNIILPRLSASEHSSRHSLDEGGLEPCAICLEDYKQGDEVCWSHNHHCAHVFHQECLVEWLCCHEGCPVCRQDFLALEDLDNEGTQIEQPESMERPYTEIIRTDVVPSSTGEPEDRSTDEVPHVPSIQRIVEPRHQDELEHPDVRVSHFQPRLPPYDEESLLSLVAIQGLDKAETELPESVERLPTEETDDSLVDEVHSPTEEIEDRSVDDVHRCSVNTITLL